MTTGPIRAEPGRLRLPRNLRIRSGGDFSRAYREGSRARGDALIVVCVTNDRPYARVGLSVGRRIWRRAVQRNRVRRVFREAFRLARPALPTGFDFVLIPARPGLRPGLEDTREELVRLARKAARRQLERRASEAADDGAPG